MRRACLALALFAPALLAVGLVALGNPEPSGAAGTVNSITSPETTNDVGRYSSLALDALGYPVVGHYDRTNKDLRIVRCNDPNCAGGDESATSPDSAGDVGLYSSIALDASEFPVVSYYDEANRDLRLLHCNDPDCSGGDESVAVPDFAGDVGTFTSLALDGSGMPVVAYYSATDTELKILHCNDPNCTGGDDSVQVPDATVDFGEAISLKLDSSGNPVVSYYDITGSDLNLLHCNDPDCAGNDESITAPDTQGFVGSNSSLALDALGYPVISYRDNTFSHDGTSPQGLKVVHCNDPDCAGGDEAITRPDASGSVGWTTSLELDATGAPVVSYYDFTSFDLKVLHCGTPDCSAGNTIIAPDVVGDVGYQTSLTLDSLGNPVVSYGAGGNFLGDSDLRILHCGEPTCVKGAPTPTPTITPTETKTPTTTRTPTFTPRPPTPTPPPPVGGVSLDAPPGAAGAHDASQLLVLLITGAAAFVMAGAAWLARRTS